MNLIAGSDTMKNEANFRKIRQYKYEETKKF